MKPSPDLLNYHVSGSTIPSTPTDSAKREFLVRTVERIELERKPNPKKNMLLGRPIGMKKTSMYHQIGAFKQDLDPKSASSGSGIEELISVKSFIDLQNGTKQAKSAALPTGYYGPRRFNSEVALHFSKPSRPKLQNSHFFKLPVKFQALQNTLSSISKVQSLPQVRSSVGKIAQKNDTRSPLDSKAFEEKPFFNCKPLTKNPTKPTKPEPEGLGELLDNDDTLAAFMKSGKTYNLRDVDFDDKFLNEAILPPERTQNLLEKLAHDYTPANLQLHKSEIFLVLSQQFEDIASGFGADYRELINLCYNMLLHDMQEEQNVYFNSIVIMLQSLETILIRAFEFDIDKICTKVFTMLKKIISRESPSKGIVSQMFINSFNGLAQKIFTIEPADIREYLYQSIDLIRHVVEAEHNTYAGQSSRANPLDNHFTPSITPIEGLELVLRHSQYRRLIIEDEYLWTPFSKLMSFMHDFLLQTSFNRIAGTRKQLFTVTYFAIFLSVVKHNSIQTALKHSIPGFSAENLIKTLLSLLYVSFKTDSMTSGVKDMFLTCFHNSTKVFSRYVDFNMENEDKIQDYEFYLKVYFGLHFDPDSQFLTVRNLQLAQCLLQFISQVLECAYLVSHTIYKDSWAEMSAVLQAYKLLMEKRHPISTSPTESPTDTMSSQQKETEIRKVLFGLLQILNKAKPAQKHGSSRSPKRASKLI
jgi:hypothetical protein